MPEQHITPAQSHSPRLEVITLISPNEAEGKDGIRESAMKAGIPYLSVQVGSPRSPEKQLQIAEFQEATGVTCVGDVLHTFQRSRRYPALVFLYLNEAQSRQFWSTRQQYARPERIELNAGEQLAIAWLTGGLRVA